MAQAGKENKAISQKHTLVDFKSRFFLIAHTHMKVNSNL